MSEPAEDAPKIIVDDDWKTQVEKEKREAAASAAASSSAARADEAAGGGGAASSSAAAESSIAAAESTSGAAESSGGAAESTSGAAESTSGAARSSGADSSSDSQTSGLDRSGAERRGYQSPEIPPPATFEMLITMLFTQAMASLGQLPGPDGEMGPVNKAFAKYFIDTIELLGEKTKGNLSDDESKMISETLHAMRMAFVSVKAK